MISKRDIMSDFTRVCKTSDIPDPGKVVFEIEERFVVVFHLDGEFMPWTTAARTTADRWAKAISRDFRSSAPGTGPASTFAPGRR